MNFSFDQASVEFGVGIEINQEQAFYCIQVDRSVKNALSEMAKFTFESMISISHDPQPYDPSQKYSSDEHLSFSIESEAAIFIKNLHMAINLPINMAALNDPAGVFCYFARFTDSGNNKLTAIRRATQFKGTVRQKLITLINDNFKLVPDKVFKLDRDFDLLVIDEQILIYHPAGFEHVGTMEDCIRAAIPLNVQAISQALPIVDYTNILPYALEHTRAGKYLASIKASGEMNNIDRDALIGLCNDTQVAINSTQDLIIVDDKHILGFLELLDRRRYCISLVPDSPEKYLAAHRNKL